MIGVFDSGLGGLTVLRSLIDLVPSVDVVYFGDTGRFPYGPKPGDDVLKYSLEIGDVLLDRGADLIVVACNSAAAVALDALADRLPIPVIGVIEPGLSAAATRHAQRTRRGHRYRRHDHFGGIPIRRVATRPRARAHVCRVPRIRRVRGGG